MAKLGKRISRVGNSFRVRIAGHPVTYFSPRTYGGEEQALEAARAWRDERWDGKPKGQKLTARQVRAIQQSTAPYKFIAKRYGISPNYVHTLRRRAPDE